MSKEELSFKTRSQEESTREQEDNKYIASSQAHNRINK